MLNASIVTSQRSGYPKLLWRKSADNLEIAYASIVLFVLTQGPVYRVWASSISATSILPSPTSEHIYFVTFLTFQLPGLVLLTRRIDEHFVRRRDIRSLAALIIWLGLSVFWSTFARQSLPEFISLVFTTCFGLYLAISFSHNRILVCFAIGTSIGVGLSWISIFRVWEGSINFQESYWTGIYMNRNSLAPVSAVAFATSGILLIRKLTVWNWRHLIEASALLYVGALAFIILWKSDSLNSRFSLLYSFVVCLVQFALHGVSRQFLRAKNTVTYLTRSAVPVALLLLLTCIWVVGQSEYLNSKTQRFSSRSQVWSVNWSGFIEKPFQGWGWMAAWKTPGFKELGEWWVLWDTTWAHSSYFDLILGGGLVAGILFLTTLSLACRLTYGLRSPGTNLSATLLSLFVLTASSQESFIIGSHFMWALLVAVLFGIRGEGTNYTVSKTAPA